MVCCSLRACRVGRETTLIFAGFYTLRMLFENRETRVLAPTVAEMLPFMAWRSRPSCCGRASCSNGSATRLSGKAVG